MSSTVTAAYPNETDEALAAFRASVRSFAEKRLLPMAEQWEEAGAFPGEVYRQLGDMGWLGIRIAEEFGGADQSFLYSAAFVEELCRCGSVGLVISVVMHAEIATPLLALLGTDEQKRTFLPPAMKGESIAGLAITEPGAGSDVAAIKTFARRDGDEYIINGSKTFITNGSTADFLLVLATTDREAGHRGLSLFIVPTATTGFSVGKKLRKLGNRTSDTALIHFEDCHIPACNLLGSEGKAFYYIMNNFQAERIMGGVLSCALSRLMWEDGLNYARSRQAFDRPVAAFQVWRHELAQLAAEIEACRTLTYRGLALLDQKADSTAIVSMSKLLSCELVEKVSTRMLQIHGGYGYMEEYPIARYYRDVRLMTIGGGSTEIMREIIAKQCGIDAENKNY